MHMINVMAIATEVMDIVKGLELLVHVIDVMAIVIEVMDIVIGSEL